MALNPQQQQTVATWAREGVSLAEIQSRIGTEFGVTMTYMEVRFLVDDLKVDLPPPPPPPPAAAPPEAAPPAGKPAARKGGGLFGFGRKDEPAAAEPPAGVVVDVDRVMKPGTLISGTATFSDNETAKWFMDETGRLGFQPTTPGYKPSAEDIQDFQMALQGELRKLGYA